MILPNTCIVQFVETKINIDTHPINNNNDNNNNIILQLQYGK